MEAPFSVFHRGASRSREAAFPLCAVHATGFPAIRLPRLFAWPPPTTPHPQVWDLALSATSHGLPVHHHHGTTTAGRRWTCSESAPSESAPMDVQRVRGRAPARTEQSRPDRTGPDQTPCIARYKAACRLCFLRVSSALALPLPACLPGRFARVCGGFLSCAQASRWQKVTHSRPDQTPDQTPVRRRGVSSLLSFPSLLVCAVGLTRPPGWAGLGPRCPPSWTRARARRPASPRRRQASQA